jgi:molybdate transport system ATP-binding protein
LPEQAEQAASRLREFVPEAVGRSFGVLSFAEQRLVVIVRALVRAPELLILDEPCHGLDARNRAHVIEAVDRAVQTHGTSVLYVTHQADELPTCITHVLELRMGHVVRSGPTQG